MEEKENMFEDAKMIERLDVFPAMTRFLQGDFLPKLDEKLKKVEYKTLIQIRLDEGRKMSYYSDKVDLERGSFTYSADKLEKRGYIKRVTVEGDRRKKILMLTEEGRKVTEEINRQFLEYLAEQFKKLSENDVKKFFEAVNNLEGIRFKLDI